MYESGQLESVFIEILNDKKKNEIVGCIYRHPTMEIKPFNENYFEDFITKITNEKKICYLAGDFNINLLQSETDSNIKDFFDILTSNLLVPHISRSWMTSPCCRNARMQQDEFFSGWMS